MRRHILTALVLLGLGCSNHTAADGDAGAVPVPDGSPVIGADWSRMRLRHHRLEAEADASIPTPGPDASTTSVDASTTTPDAGSTTIADASTTTVDSGGFIPAGWLYTKGSAIYVSNGTSGSPWMGRGVNVDDLYFCGYNGSLWMSDPGSSLSTITSSLVVSWKPSFVRVSLGMNSYTSTSWSTASYSTPMTSVIDALASSGVYVLVTLRSDATMTNYGADDATYVPNPATDAVYQAIVDSFASSSHVLFGVSNEPGGNSLSNATLRSTMDHVVGVIRAEEDKLGAQHHIVSVQGNSWTSDISFYATSPLGWDNVVYEVHGYPPPASSYTYSNIPVIIGEYGTLSDPTAFFADVESKQIPNLAWDFEPFSDCAPDLLTITASASSLVASSWGSTVQAYLLAH